MERIHEFKILNAYSSLFYDDRPYAIISGGRGSGKSTQVAVYFIMKLFGDEFFRGMISRYTSRSVKMSIYRDIIDLLELFGLSQYVIIKGEEIINKLNDNMIITHSFKLSDATQSAKGKGLASITHAIIDEAQELPSEEEYIKVIDTLRTKGVERKIFVVFNPGSKRHWIFKRWFINDVHHPNPKWNSTHIFIHTTYKDNIENLDPSKVLEWDMAEVNDNAYYKHHILGEFRDSVQGQIYTDFKVGKPDPSIDYERVIGLDWGFANDQLAVVETLKKNNNVYVKELVYSIDLRISSLANILKDYGITKKDIIIADSAEPRSIDALSEYGFTVLPAYKGSVNYGIEKIKELTVYMDPSSENLHAEVDLYAWNPLNDKPIKKHDHLLDAMRYALVVDGPTNEYAVMGPKKSYAYGR
ncbi:MAG: PBSX family phage terminase large subunit [Candidatus Cloacimonetes bacterium]|nr:PBSX family phage terminase large subunit [Candidatus Cloacimonadota bacterium]